MRLTLSGFVLAVIAVGPAIAHADPITKDQCIAANEDAQVAQRDGHLFRARDQLRLCIVASCPEAVRADCADQLKAVESAIPSVIIDATDANGALVPGVRVSIDGAAAIPVPDSRSVEVEPGAHRFIFTRDGGAGVVAQSTTLKEGEHDRHIGVSFAGFGGPSSSTDADHSSGHLPVTALVLGGAGVLSLLVGAVFWRSAISNNDSSYANGHCDATGCDATGKGLRNDALGDATAATVAVVLGLGAFAAGGVVLYFGESKGTTTRASRVGVRPIVGAGGGGLVVGGGW